MLFVWKRTLALLLFGIILVLAAVPVCAADGLVAHYAFEKNLADATGKFGNGQPIGSRIGPTVGAVTSEVGDQYFQVEYGEGVQGSALRFNGGVGILLPSGLITGSTYSISLWIYPEALTQHTTTFFGAVSGNSWISIVPDGPTTHYTMLWSGERWFDGTAGLTIPLNQWTHFAAAVDQGHVVVYINGEKKFDQTGFPDIFGSFTGDAVFALGVNWWDAPFEGLVDELKIYDRVLAPEEI